MNRFHQALLVALLTFLILPALASAQKNGISTLISARTSIWTLAFGPALNSPPIPKYMPLGLAADQKQAGR